MNKKTVFPHWWVFFLTISLLVLTQSALATDIGFSPATSSSNPTDQLGTQKPDVAQYSTRIMLDFYRFIVRNAT